MTQEKQLLLKDLCARLPYGIKGIHRGQVHNITNMDGNSLYPSIQVDGYDAWFPVETFKPYLRSMESMTEDEERELSIILNYEFYIDDDFALVAEDDRHRIRLELCEGYIDWLNEHHFDFRGLIEKGLALEAPVNMYKQD